MRRFAALALLLALCVANVLPARAAANVSIDARDTELSDVIALIARQSGLNLVPDASVKARRITFRLTGVDANTALATLVQAYDLQTHRTGNIVLIGDAGSMNRRYGDGSSSEGPRTEVFVLTHAKPEDMSAALLAALPPGTVAVPDKRTASVIVTASGITVERARRLVLALDGPAFGSAGGLSSIAITLRFAKASDAVKQLKGSLPESAVIADDRSNSIVVTGSAELQATARALVEGLDRPGRQVLFEVRVTEVKPIDDNTNVGVLFGGPGFGTGAVGQFPFTLTAGSVIINAQLNALVQNGHAQVLATPRIATLNNREASLLVGQTYPIVTVNQQTGFPTVTNVNVGVQLRLTPTIGTDGVITAELHPEYSAIIGFNSTFPIIANRKIDSTLRVRDGETIVLGGLFEDTSSETITKLPFLSEIPILGQFFKNKATTRQRDEVVFLITPHILDPNASKPDN